MHPLRGAVMLRLLWHGMLYESLHKLGIANQGQQRDLIRDA